MPTWTARLLGRMGDCLLNFDFYSRNLAEFKGAVYKEIINRRRAGQAISGRSGHPLFITGHHEPR